MKDIIIYGLAAIPVLLGLAYSLYVFFWSLKECREMFYASRIGLRVLIWLAVRNGLTRKIIKQRLARIRRDTQPPTGEIK